MKIVSLLVVSLATVIGLSTAFTVSPSVAPYFGPAGPFYPGAFGGLGLGLGLGGIGGIGGLGLGLGGLGLGGLGLGGLGGLGLGLGLGGPFTSLALGMGTFGPGGNARMFGPRGRRSLDAQIHGVKKDHGDVRCELSRNFLNCVGPHEIIQCEVESHVTLPIEIGHFKLTDFTLREKVINKVVTLKVLPKNVSHRMGHKLEHLSIFENEQLAATEPGFLIKDSACFNDVLTLVKEIPDKIKLKLNDAITTD